MDSGDKATNKAMAVAHKYCLFQAFCLPTEETKDTDADTPDVEPDHKKALKDYIDIGIKEGYKSAVEKWLNENLKDIPNVEVLPNLDCKTFLEKLTKDSLTFVKDKKNTQPIVEKPKQTEPLKPKNEPVPVTDIKTDLPEDRQNPFVPFVKGGENVKAKTETKTDSKTVFFAPGAPVDAKFTEEKAEVSTLKDSSAKLRDEYANKIAELKTRAECTALSGKMATIAGSLTEQDRAILRSAFENKRNEITAAIPKTKESDKPTSQPEFKVGDKVVVKAKPTGAVALEGEITAIKTIDNKPAATLKGVAMPVFLSNCYLK